MAGYTLYELTWMFFLYAFLGWCTEVGFAAVKQGKFVNRGFLNGPICPIYGFGVLSIVVLLTPLTGNLLYLFVGSICLTTALEYFTGWVLEKVFHAKWWDYSKEKFNLNGYICLEFSLIWGFAATFVMKLIHPMIYRLISWLPQLVGGIALGVLLVVIAADLAATIATVRNLQKRLRLLTTMAEEIHEVSDKLGDAISGRVVSTKQYAEETTERYSEYKAMREAHLAEEKSLAEQHRGQEAALLEALREEGKELREERQEELRARLESRARQLREKLAERKILHNRLLRAFPGLQFEKYQQQLEELRKSLKK